MSEVRTLHRSGLSVINAWVNQQSLGYDSGIEFGCGVGAYTRAMLCHRRVGIDAFEPYIIEAVATPENHGIDFVCGDMRHFESLVSGPYDFALFIDSLEHIPKDDALELIVRCQRAFKKIALFIPIGFHDNDPCDGNDMQRHLSTWDEVDLLDMGFYVNTSPYFHPEKPGKPGEQQAAAFAQWFTR